MELTFLAAAVLRFLQLGIKILEAIAAALIQLLGPAATVLV